MRSIVLALLASFASVAAAQFVGDRIDRDYVYGLTPGLTNYQGFDSQTIPGGMCLISTGTANSDDGYYACNTAYLASFLPAKVHLEGSSTVRRRGSGSYAISAYFTVAGTTAVRMTWKNVCTPVVWWDQASAYLYATSPNVSLILGNTATGSGSAVLQPGVLYRLYSTVNRNNLYQGGESMSTMSQAVDLIALGAVMGKVNLQSYVGPIEGLMGSLEILSSGTVVESIGPMVLNANGEFAAASTHRGTYDVRIKISHWLSRVVGPVQVSDEGITLPPVDLINGDCNGDNAVDASDYFVLSDAYESEAGNPAYDVQADLNGDLVVDASDYFILSDAYELTGE